MKKTILSLLSMLALAVLVTSCSSDDVSSESIFKTEEQPKNDIISSSATATKIARLTTTIMSFLLTRKRQRHWLFWSRNYGLVPTSPFLDQSLSNNMDLRCINFWVPLSSTQMRASFWDMLKVV